MLGRVLVALSGADTKLLDRCPRDRPKYVGIGGAVLSTGVMAAFAATLALQMTVDAPLWAALGFGAVWGVIILNLDRWLVASTHRESGWFRSMLVLLPRLALAVVIGGIIAEPLVLRVFETSIESEMETVQAERQVEFETELGNDPQTARMTAIVGQIADDQAVVRAGVTAGDLAEDPEVARLRAQREALRTQRDEVIVQIDCEARGTCGTANYGEGPEFRRLTERRAELEAEIGALEVELDQVETDAGVTRSANAERAVATAEANIDANRAELAELEAAQQRRRDDFERKNEDRTGLLARMEALDRLTADSEALNTRYWALRIFVTLIDSLPVLVKLMMIFSAPTMYERLAKSDGERLNRQIEADEKNYDPAAAIVGELVLDEAQVTYAARHNDLYRNYQEPSRGHRPLVSAGPASQRPGNEPPETVELRD